MINRLLLFSIIALILVFGTHLIIFGTTTFSDALRGFEILNQWENGGKWNTLQYPSVHDPSYEIYVAWWTPAQWLIPLLISKLIGSNSIQWIQGLLIFPSLLIALLGYYKLFRKLKFNYSLVLLSLISIISNQLFYWHFLMYYGGDLLLITLFPYFIIFLLSLEKRSNWLNVYYFLLFLLVGVFFKNTFLLIALCSLCWIWFSTNRNSFYNRLTYVIPFLFVCCTVYFFVQFVHLNKGDTPASSFDLIGYNGIPNTFIGDITYPLSSAIGIFSRASFVIQKVMPSNVIGIVIMLILTLISITAIGYIMLKERSRYESFLLYFTLPFFLFFVVFYLQDKSISYDMRHFGPVAFLWFPWIIDQLIKHFPTKLAVGGIIFLSLVDVGWYFQSSKTLHRTHSRWSTYILPNHEVILSKYIEQWDNRTSQGLCIVNGHWTAGIAIKRNDKWLIEWKKGKCWIQSGMEINHPKEWQPDQIEFNRYTQLLIVNGNSILTKRLSLKGYTLSSTTFRGDDNIRYRLDTYLKKKLNTQ